MFVLKAPIAEHLSCITNDPIFVALEKEEHPKRRGGRVHIFLKWEKD